jgi:hypothetical protein
MQRHFDCVYQYDDGKVDTWSGDIAKLINYGSHYEMRIESLSDITVLFGRTSLGTFACLPDFHGGCHLVDLSNEMYSTDHLCGPLRRLDAITVAKALKIVADHFGGSSFLNRKGDEEYL